MLVLGIPLPSTDVAERVGPGIVRYDASAAARRDALPSLALVRPMRGREIAPGRIRPVFGREGDRNAVRTAVPKGTDLYGTGEIAGPLRRNGKVTECWNTDAGGADEAHRSLYQSHPWVLGMRPDGTAFGVLADTTYRCRIDLRDGIAFAAEGPEFSVYVIERKSPEEVLKGLADLTGRMELPPMWALGYHQCRWSYMSQEEGLSIARGFREHHIPCDTLWFDIDYMDGFRVFTFNPKTFPDPKGLNARLASMGFHNVYMIDPGVKADPGYGVYDSGTAKSVWVLAAAGGPQHGKVWPGDSLFPDFTRPETRAWWSSLYGPFMAQGVSGVWNDMNEPSNFGGPNGGTLPDDARHRGGGPFTPGDHARYHNAYAKFMVQASHDGIQAANPEKRPFLLTRAGYLGYQRYAATWTGDNRSTWRGMHDGITVVTNLGLSGQPFAGPDIGGFFDEEERTPERLSTYFARSWALGALMPFSRGHTAAGMRRREPWALGPHVESVARAALERRYRLLPYLYTVFEEAARTGLPVLRPLFFADVKRADLRGEDHGFLLGADLAVQAPLDAPEHRVELGWPTLPSLAADDDDPDAPKVQVRPGAILPVRDAQEFTGEKPFDHLTLLIVPDAKGRAEGTLYEDAGDGFGYRRGDFRRSTFLAVREGGRLRVSFGRAEGRRPATSRRLTVRAWTGAAWVSGEGVEGRGLDLKL